MAADLVSPRKPDRKAYRTPELISSRIVGDGSGRLNDWRNGLLWTFRGLIEFERERPLSHALPASN